jgi:hypothetical protein
VICITFERWLNVYCGLKKSELNADQLERARLQYLKEDLEWKWLIDKAREEKEHKPLY